MSRVTALVDEIANELDTWPGVRVERRSDGAAIVRYGHLELGVLDPDGGVVELRVSGPEHDELVEHGAAEPADSMPDSEVVSHGVHGPSDVTAVLELFDRRYRDLSGEGGPYSSQDPA
ncbi:MAG TPA: luciferase family protein [Solirubrobacteraceae bacterium]|nr:luciferase family protein [Solirubrobacteraceae bacterium]